MTIFSVISKTFRSMTEKKQYQSIMKHTSHVVIYISKKSNYPFTAITHRLRTTALNKAPSANRTVGFRNRWWTVELFKQLPDLDVQRARVHHLKSFHDA